MEEYEDVGSNTLIAYDATDATDTTTASIERQEQEAWSQSLLIARQLELEVERNQLGDPGVLKATNGDAAKQWKMRQETNDESRKVGKGCYQADSYPEAPD